jgi:hypothetical protein
MNLTFEDKDKAKLDDAKEECEKKRKQKLSWEEYFLIKLIDKII